MTNKTLTIIVTAIVLIAIIAIVGSTTISRTDAYAVEGESAVSRVSKGIVLAFAMAVPPFLLHSLMAYWKPVGQKVRQRRNLARQIRAVDVELETNTFFQAGQEDAQHAYLERTNRHEDIYKRTFENERARLLKKNGGNGGGV